MTISDSKIYSLKLCKIGALVCFCDFEKSQPDLLKLHFILNYFAKNIQEETESLAELYLLTILTRKCSYTTKKSYKYIRDQVG